MEISRDLIRTYLDELQISTRIDDDGDLVVVQGADDDFGHDVIVFIMVNNNRLSYAAGVSNYTPAGDILQLANRHNCRAYMPTAVVRDGNIRMEWSILLDEEVSKDFIVENCIRMPMGLIWRSFCDLEKDEI